MFAEMGCELRLSSGRAAPLAGLGTKLDSTQNLPDAQLLRSDRFVTADHAERTGAYPEIDYRSRATYRRPACRRSTPGTAPSASEQRRGGSGGGAVTMRLGDQNASDEPLLLKIFVCVTVTSAGPTHAATLLDPVV